AGASRIATGSGPPYCGRVAAASDAISTLLTTSHCHTKRIIIACLSIFGHGDCGIPLGLGPECGDRPRKINRGTHRYRITIGKLVSSNRIVTLTAAGREHLPSRPT